MSKNIYLMILVISTAVLTTGCSGLIPRTQIERVEVPLPIPCNIVPPKKPVMPFSDATLDEVMTWDNIYVYSQKTLAEIERRKGYETELEAAITACNSK